MDIAPFRYPQAFVLGADPQLAEWHTSSVGGRLFAHSSGTCVTVEQRQGDWCVLVGTALAPREGESDPSRIALRLLEQDDLWDYADRLAGRFACIIHRSGRTLVFTDPAGMRTVYYHGKVVGSHPSLIARAVGASQDPWVEAVMRDPAAQSVRHPPGLHTGWHGVEPVIPNTVLDVEKGALFRFYPRSPLEPTALDDATDRALAAMRAQLGLLVTPVAVGLTAGLDSRVTLAVLEGHLRDRLYFTYRDPHDPGGNETDVERARAIADALRLPHLVLHRRDPTDVAIGKRLGRFDYSSHARDLPSLYRRHLFGHPVHLRSNVGEIGRSFYRYHRRDHPEHLDPPRMAWLYRRMDHDAKVIGAFEEYASKIRYDEVWGYDPYDLFYWEHRMGMWHGPLVRDSDAVFETLSLFNSRDVLEPLLAVDRESRIKSKAFRAIIAREQPLLRSFPIN